MRVSVDRARLADALAVLERAAHRADGMGTLTGVLLEAESGVLHLRATDLELTAMAGVPIDGEAEPGATVVDARLLASIVRRLAGDTVTLTLGEGGLALQGGGSRFTLRTMPTEDFPELPFVGDAQALLVPARKLARVLGRVVVAAATSDQRPVLSGVYVEWAGDKLYATATDSYRLAHEAMTLDPEHANAEGEPITAIIPARSVQEIVRVCERAPEAEMASIEIDSRLVAVEAAGYRIVTRLIEGNFPPYRQVLLDDAPVRMAWPRKAMLEAIERLALLAGKGPAVVKISSNDGLLGGLRLSNATADVGEGEEIVALDDGTWPDGVSVAYQARFLMDALKAVDAETVTYEWDAPERPCQIRAGEYRAVIMPWRLA